MARRSRARRRQSAAALTTTGTTPAPVSEVGYGVGDAANWWGGLSAETTPELQWPASVQVYDRMRTTDTQIASVLRAVMMPVLRTQWRINPNGARDEVVQHIADDLGLPIKGADPNKQTPRRADRFSYAEHLRLALLGQLTWGHMPFEQVCRLDERGRLRLRKLAPRMPSTISEFDVADDGGLRRLKQRAPLALRTRPGQKPREPVWIPIERLVMYVHEREGGDWTGRSMLRSSYKFWALKDRVLRVQAQAIDRNGLGIPLYEGAQREADLTKGQKIAQSWRAGDSSGAAIPYGAKLTLKGVEGDLPDADKVLRYYDEQMARGALLHFLNLGTQTGSWALGSTFAEFFTMSLQALADYQLSVGNSHVVEDIVDWNWGPDELAPLLECDEIGSRHPATAESLKMLSDAGIVLPDRELEEFARQLHGLPPKGSFSRPGRVPVPENAVQRDLLDLYYRQQEQDAAAAAAAGRDLSNPAHTADLLRQIAAALDTPEVTT